MSRGLKSITFGGHLSEDISISARDLIFESIPTSSLKISLSKTFQGWPARPTGCAMSAFGGGNAGGLGPSSVCSWKGQIHPTTRTIKKTKTKNTVQRPPQVRTINPIKTHCDLEWNKPTTLRQEAYGCDRFYEMNKETYCWKGLQGIVPFRNSTMIPICFFPRMSNPQIISDVKCVNVHLNRNLPVPCQPATKKTQGFAAVLDLLLHHSRIHRRKLPSEDAQ